MKQYLLTAVVSTAFAFAASPTLGANRPLVRHGASVTSVSPRTTSSTAGPSQRDRRERAWREWYRNHPQYIRPGYYYPVGYPPDYSDSDPTPAGSSPDTSSRGTESPFSPSGTAVAPPATNAPSVQPNSGQTDPDLLPQLDLVKSACAARPDYVAAVADKNDAAEKLEELRRNDRATPDLTTPLATRALGAKKQIAIIEREETARLAKLRASQPQTQRIAR